MASKFYAVKVGKVKGIFLEWADCEAQVKGYPGAQYKSFKTLEEAEAYLALTPAMPTTVTMPAQNTVSPTVPSYGGMPSNTANANHLDVYVDGSFSGNNYGWGFAVYNGNELIHSDYGTGTNADAISMRNVAGELAATLRAVQWAVKNNRRIVIHHDYIGISAWVTGEWKTKNELTQKYAAYMNRYSNSFTFNKVKGHSGNVGNNVADKLARKALGI